MIIRVPLVERRDESDLFRELVTPEQNLIPRLGMLGLGLTPELARMLPAVRNPSGVVVAGVTAASDGSPGLMPGDVIYGVNGTVVRTLSDLRAAVGQVPSASPAVLQVGRQGQLRFVVVTLE